MKKIAVITGSRAEYGLLSPIIRKIKEGKEFKLYLIVTGMHLLRRYGLTYKEIERDGLKIDFKIPIYKEKDPHLEIPLSLGRAVTRISQALDKIRPDIILILGDRSEILACAISAAYLNIAIAHIHGGDKTDSGHIDEANRFAISRFAHLHFTASRNSAQRLKRMGEEPWRVFFVGAPSLDTILHLKLPERENLFKKYHLKQDSPFFILIQHSVPLEEKEAEYQMRESMEAIKKMGITTLVIYPNIDLGGEKIIKVIEEYRIYPFIKIYKSIPSLDFWGLMREASLLLGNSSCGIIEAPSFKLPVINIGSRNTGREHAINVLFANHDQKEIITKINTALYDEEFRKKLKYCKNPYGDGKASQRIVEILSNIEIDRRLLRKKVTY